MSGYFHRPEIHSSTVTIINGRRFFARHIVFQLAVSGLFVSVVSYVVGFSTIAWFITPKGSQFGLWQYCIKKGGCTNLLTVKGTDYWFVDVTRTLSCMALVMFLLGSGVELYQDFLVVHPLIDNRAVEAFFASAAVIGLIGATVFITKFSTLQPEESSLTDYIGWSFWLALAALVLTLLCTYLLLRSRRLRRHHVGDVIVTRQRSACVTHIESSLPSPYTVSGAADNHEMSGTGQISLPASQNTLTALPWGTALERQHFSHCKAEDLVCFPPSYDSLFHKSAV